MTALISCMKFLRTPLNAEQNQGATLGQKSLSYIVPSLSTRSMKKTTFFNTFKHNPKKKYIDNLARS